MSSHDSSGETRRRALEIRRRIIDMAHRSGSAHVGSALSCADILAVLYFEVLRLRPWENRDYFVLSKGHAAMCLYAALDLSGILEPGQADSYFLNDGALPAHLDRFTGRGIEVSAGSLGHGFNVALGLAYGLKLRRSPQAVYALIGDGESQEGSIWEGAMFAPKLGLDNVTVFLDFNNLQGYGRATELCSFEPVADKWRAFGWHAVDVDGHDHEALCDAIAQRSGGRPKMIVARTVKGKGVSFMEDQLVWHYYVVTAELRARAMEELQ
ncbi:MAG: transketolase [Candidatus Schekmanbacteria bacterium]|nr:transketolase [Candidatus Schekmanbacteria bacterium]